MLEIYLILFGGYKYYYYICTDYKQQQASLFKKNIDMEYSILNTKKSPFNYSGKCVIINRTWTAFLHPSPNTNLVHVSLEDTSSKRRKRCYILAFKGTLDEVEEYLETREGKDECIYNAYYD